jgi:hypothetical protein
VDFFRYESIKEKPHHIAKLHNDTYNGNVTDSKTLNIPEDVTADLSFSLSE